MPSAIEAIACGSGVAHREGSGARSGRGLELLTVLLEARRPMDVGALARALKATRSAAYQQLRALERLSFVSRDANGHWALSPGGATTLSSTIIGRLNLRAAGRPVLDRLAARTGETVSVNVRHHDHCLCIDRVEGRPPAPSLPLGATLPIHTSTSGRVILAFLPRPAAAALMAGAGLDGDEDRLLRADLARVRRSGYLIAVLDGARSGNRLASMPLGILSAPIFGSSGVVGAVTVLGPATRWHPDAMERAAAGVRLECATLSAALSSLPALD